MSKLKISEGADPNYLATVVKLPEVKPHPNADRLSLVEIFGNTIIVAKNLYAEGERVVYFPVECAISKEFLSWGNLLDKAELNADQKTKGFFESKGRVRCVSLRGVPSQGFVCKVSQIAKFYEIEEDEFRVGDTFDIVGDRVLVTKYVKGTSKPEELKEKKARVPKWVEKTISFFPRPLRRTLYIGINAWYNRNHRSIQSEIVDGQFKFHYKTEQLGKNLFLLTPEDNITVTSKIHGCVEATTPIETLEYGMLSIKEIVDKKLQVHVRGYDIENHNIRWVKVDDYYFRPNDGDWYDIELEDGRILTITGNNPVWMNELQCYRKVENLKVGDDLLVENFK